jgi:hypothetical protein
MTLSQLAVVMHARLGVRSDVDSPGPKLLSANARMVDCRLPKHPGRLRGICVELIAFDDPHAVMLPAIIRFNVLVVAGHCRRGP